MKTIPPFEAKLLRHVLPLMAGIAFSWQLRHHLHGLSLVMGGIALLLCVGICFVGSRKQNLTSWTFGVLVSIFFFVLGNALLLHSYESTLVEWPSTPCCYKAVVVTAPRVGEKSTQCEMRILTKRKGKEWQEMDARVQVSLLNNDTVNVSVADAFLLKGKIEKLHNAGNPDEFDYASWLQRKGIQGTLFVGNNYQKCSPLTTNALWNELSFIQRLKITAIELQHSLSHRYSQRAINIQAQGVLSAMTLGDKYALRKDVRLLYSETGASHVLALSGLHLGILVWILMLLLRPFRKTAIGKWLSVVVCLLFIWTFAFLTGLNTSLVRSAVMFSLFLMLHVQRKESLPLNSLAMAGVIILLLQPMALMDAGFQLSFLSVFSILFFQRFYLPVRPQRRWLAMMADFVYVAMAAQVATAPLVAYYYHIVPCAFLLTNIIVIPCTYLLLGGSLLFHLVFPFVKLSQGIGHLMESVAGFMQSSLETITRIPGSFLEFYPSWVTLVLSYGLLGILLLLWIRRSKPVLLTTLLVTGLWLTSILNDSTPAPLRPQVVFYNVPSCPSAHFITSADTSYLWIPHKANYQRLEATVSTFWQHHGIRHVHQFDGHYNCPILSSHSNIVQFNGRKYVFVHNDAWRHRKAISPMKIEALYISHGCYTPLSHMLQLWNPSYIILHASLSDTMRHQYKAEAQSLHLPLHDMRERGALVL